MRQLYQDPKSGAVLVAELPDPALRAGTLLVRNVCSVISPGTERATVATGRDSYLKTARNRPDLVRRVLDSVKRDGVIAAYRKVQAKLSEPKALGYASAGIVFAVGDDAGDYFRVGDRVACCGQGVASHAEVVCVPVNLAARIPESVPFDAAAFATLGAIALHGVRQSEPTLGERFAVIGCGILGLFATQLLRAHGARVAAYDLEPDLVARAKILGADEALAGGVDDQVASALAWTEGVGVDGVIVTAASASDAPMVAAAGMCRDRGRVVAVGLVPFGLPREIAYAKELNLRISRSYGAGRYDAAFEERGIDYPIGHVRWTETRNLEAFLEVIADGRLDVGSLITHRYPLDQAPQAYDMLLAKGGPKPLGIVIDYPAPQATVPETKATSVATRAATPAAAAPMDGTIGISFIGAGAFARGTLLPLLKGRDGVKLRSVVTAHGLSAVDAQKRFGFDEVGTDAQLVLDDPSVHLVCIATRHDMHADLVARALRAGKHVFCEKPLALNNEELSKVEEAAASSQRLLLVGFNRRFSPLAKAAREVTEGRGARVMTCRVNAGTLPPGHWLNDLQIGGGRMIGEGCHFVDLLSYLCGDPPIDSVAAASAGRSTGAAEDFAVTIGFGDGSIGQIAYTAKGAAALGKERIEVHAGGVSVTIDDWKSATVARGPKTSNARGSGKGHSEEITALLDAIRTGQPSPIPVATLIGVTRATFRVHKALQKF